MRMDATAPRRDSNVYVLDPLARVLDPLVSQAREALQQQARAISQIGTRLDERFARAVRILHECDGHVVVTGLGKSGHVGRKIAATLASTGTPSFFVHAAEALHGDLGMVTARDVVILISYSGETREVVQLLPFLEERGIETIALAGDLDSTLARTASVSLDVSVEREICPNDLAPTSSTLATLAMGDVLAISLMKLRDFQRDDFAQLHPGGAVGRRVTRVSQATVREGVAVVTPETPLCDALLELASSPHPMALVCGRNGGLRGVLTAEDVRAAGKRAMDRPVAEVMNEMPPVVSADAFIAVAEERLSLENLPALVVVGEHDHVEGLYLPRTE